MTQIVQTLRYHLPVQPPFLLLIQSLSSALGLCDPQPTRTLSKKCELRTEGHEVSVNIFCEPENPVDSKAIAFRCQIGDEWHTIGYIVREALDSVHTAIRNQDIISVRFSWVSYLVSWSRSGPGYYAGINITVRGRWPQEVVRCASTR